MRMSLETIGIVLGALVTAFLVSLITTPIVKNLAQKWGAVDVPKDGRRMHDHPIPRMGGLAIFLGFLLSVILFSPFLRPGGLTVQLQGMLIGAVIIVVLGIFDDIYALPALPKLLVQIVTAVIAVASGNLIDTVSNPNIFSAAPYWHLGWLAYPVTVLWIVAVTNAVNLIDGLDGLACGVSAISSMTVLVIALTVAEPSVAVLMACLAGGCLGFLPYNMNPAKIFMGDTGSTFLGYVLAVVSIQGLFKYYTLISFVVPFLMLGLPIFDTCFAFIRRIAHGQSPMHADRSHIHHRLIDMGLSQKQAVGVLYVISAILGLSAVVLTTVGSLRAMLLLFALFIAGAMSILLFLHGEEKKHDVDSGPAVHDHKDKEEER
ncbi:MraY family glycosyltransferase [Pseudoflavonifractor sp. MSJ-37]|uniref:MraY family glycosyltransferase n=1 Tax=Pseudoflavonifractor sp. MSJ-37 TaxID=2841531 RepID=UPI001C12272A|nr:MraY family glycosyltransferase [Pseudoflavonifractor sp. MSJ-37]MBU5434526.1 undecaprenyl/decaprenyl-phosphate alpha-N-acetylglucosaminyl 1-phosphate transferase [Pseudoflavonifractor sp. MSJ-37]